MNRPLYQHPMRRTARQLSHQDCLQYLRQGEWGILSLVGKGGQPYGVPLNYVLVEGDALAGVPTQANDISLLFHCASEGLKLDILDQAPQGCFTVVAQAETVADKLTTRYESVLAFGPVRRLIGEAHDVSLHHLGMRFSRAYPDMLAHELHTFGPKVVMLQMDILGLTGKFNPGK